MEDRQQWLSMAAVVIVIVGLGFFLYRQSREEAPVEITSEDQMIEERANEVVEQMQAQLPENALRANLRDVSGGSGAGVATRVENEKAEDELSVLAALPDPVSGEFYEAYLAGAGEEVQYLGRLSQAKGGWRLETQAEPEEGMSQVRVTREQVADQQPEEILLEGSF